MFRTESASYSNHTHLCAGRAGHVGNLGPGWSAAGLGCGAQHPLRKVFQAELCWDPVRKQPALGFSAHAPVPTPCLNPTLQVSWGKPCVCVPRTTSPAVGGQVEGWLPGYATGAGGPVDSWLLGVTARLLSGAGSAASGPGRHAGDLL